MYKYMKLTNLIPINSGKSISKLLFITALFSNSLFSYAQQQQVRLTGELRFIHKQGVAVKSCYDGVNQRIEHDSYNHYHSRYHI